MEWRRRDCLNATATYKDQGVPHLVEQLPDVVDAQQAFPVLLETTLAMPAPTPACPPPQTRPRTTGAHEERLSLFSTFSMESVSTRRCRCQALCKLVLTSGSRYARRNLAGRPSMRHQPNGRRIVGDVRGRYLELQCARQRTRLAGSASGCHISRRLHGRGGKKTCN